MIPRRRTLASHPNNWIPSATMSLNVTIPDTFNGPLGLLHSLIVRDEIDIYDIPIARLTASYCEEIEKMEVINIDEGAEFLDLASRLKDIKLRMLLPPEDLLDEEEDEDGGFDPRSSLVEALLEYRRFKDAARLLGDLAEEQARRYPRVSPRMQFRFIEPEATEDNDSLGLFMAMQSMLDRLSVPEVIESHEIPISTRIEQIEEVLAKRDTARFSLLLSSTPDRKEMVAFFIAILELIRRGTLTARQTDNFSDIILERRRREPEGARKTTFKRVCPTACFPSAATPNTHAAGARPKKPAAAFPAASAVRLPRARAKTRRPGVRPPFPAANAAQRRSV